MTVIRREVVGEEIQYDGTNVVEVVAFLGGPNVADAKPGSLPGPGRGMTQGLVIRRLRDTMTVPVGGWIVKQRGEFRTFWPEAFEREYTRVAQGSTRLTIEFDPEWAEQATHLINAAETSTVFDFSLAGGRNVDGAWMPGYRVVFDGSDG